MTGLTIILIAAASMVAIGVLSVLSWFIYTGYLSRVERRLAHRKGIYRDLVAGLATRERALLEPALHQPGTLHDFEALEAVLEEQARVVTERPAWLLDAYDRLGLVDKYVAKLRSAKQWRERAFAAELLGRVGNAKAVPALLETIQATRNEDADVREISLRALARIADPRAIEPLVEALKQAEVWLAPRIADILGRHGQQVVEPMVAFLEEPKRHPARAWAANILGEMKATRAFPTLVRALNDLDDEVRAKAAGALGKLGDRRAITYLLDHLLTDPAPFVRARIAGALGQFNDAEVIDRLVRALGDPAWWVRMRSVEALEQIGEVAEAPLMLALDDPDPEIRIRAAVALERLGVPNRIIARIEQGTEAADTRDLLAKFGAAGARELLAEHLLHASPRVREAVIEAIRRAGRQDLGNELIEAARRDTEPRVRATALDTLRALGVRDAISVALDALGDPNERVRTSAMDLVGELGKGDVAETIRPRASDPEAIVRAAAARALGLIRAGGVEAEFTRLLQDPVAQVRAAAAGGVAQCGWSGAVPELTTLLGDVDLEVRKSAAHALGVLADRSAIPALVRAFRDGSGDLREIITEAVARLDLEALPPLLDILLQGQDVQSRLAAVRTISHIRSPQAVRLMALLWRDADPAVRAAAGEALGRLGDQEGTGGLLQDGLTDPDEVVRAHAVDGLVRLHRQDLGPEITALLRDDPSSLVRERAALAVGLFLLPGGEVELLRACHADQPLGVRAAAALAIGAYDQESIVARIIEMADEESLREFLRDRLKNDPEYRLLGLKLHDARQVELRALGSSTREQMEASLAEGMRGTLNPEQRIRLVAGLRAFQGDRSRSALLQVVRSDPSPEVRAAALIAVGGMLDVGELLLTARRALADPHADVRRAAVQLFTKLAPEQALPLLIRTLRADDDPVILQAVAAQAEAAFEVFIDLTLGLALDGEEAIMVAQTARYIHHPEVRRILPVLARSQTAPVREAVADVWVHRTELIDEPAVEQMMTDPSVGVRRAAARVWIAARRYDRISAMLEDPEPDIRQDLALGLLAAPADSPTEMRRVGRALERFVGDPDEMVRAMAFVVRILRGAEDENPGRYRLSRPAAARAALHAASLEDLRRRATDEVEASDRLSAALILAVLDDEVAHAVARNDPVRQVRKRVGALLAAWGPKPAGEDQG